MCIWMKVITMILYTCLRKADLKVQLSAFALRHLAGRLGSGLSWDGRDGWDSSSRRLAQVSLDCLGPMQATPRYLTTAYWLFQTKIIWEAARGGFWLSSPSLNAGNRSPCDRCPPWSWILRDNIAKSYKTQSLKSPYK